MRKDCRAKEEEEIFEKENLKKQEGKINKVARVCVWRNRQKKRKIQFVSRIKYDAKTAEKNNHKNKRIKEKWK